MLSSTPWEFSMYVLLCLIMHCLSCFVLYLLYFRYFSPLLIPLFPITQNKFTFYTYSFCSVPLAPKTSRWCSGVIKCCIMVTRSPKVFRWITWSGNTYGGDRDWISCWLGQFGRVELGLNWIRKIFDDAIPFESLIGPSPIVNYCISVESISGSNT